MLLDFLQNVITRPWVLALGYNIIYIALGRDVSYHVLITTLLYPILKMPTALGSLESCYTYYVWYCWPWIIVYILGKTVAIVF